ncbi:MAG: glycosyltransferase family 4 protein [Bacilli bacterium]
MKIVYICEGLVNSAGIERIVSLKANYFAEIKKKEVFIIVTSNKNEKPYYELSSEVRIIDLNCELNSIGGIINYRSKLKNKLELINPDVVLVLSGKEGLIYPFIDKKNYKVREIHFNKKSRKIQNQNLNFIKRKMFDLIDKLEDLSLKKYNKLVVLTKEDKKNWNHKDIEVIPNFKTLKINESSFLINKKAISVGRLDYQKGFDRLIKAWSLIKNKDWILEIYGDGPLKNDLEEQILELRLEKNIFLKGVTRNIEEKLLESSIYILTSRHEGLPLVLLEAMECGLPIISFDCPCGPKDIIKDGYNGYLVENGNIKELSKSIEALISNFSKIKEIGANSKKESERYNMEKIMIKWEELIKSEHENV